MSSRSIVDRVLLCAAAVCAAGLVWQLTVLVMSKGHASSTQRVEIAASSSIQSSTEPQPVPAVSTVRVVYPGVIPVKTTTKATDSAGTAPMALISPASLTGGTALPVSTAPAAPPSALPPPDQVAEAASSSSVSDAPAPVSTRMPAPTPVNAEGARAPMPSPTVVASAQPALATDAAAATPKDGAGQGLNINHASIDSLNHLRGAGRIGQAIANHRPYRSVEDLLKKRVVRRDVYEQIKSQLAAE